MSENFGDANNIINVSAVCIFQVAGGDRWIDFGNIVQVSGNLGVTKKQAYFSKDGFLQLAKDVVTQIKPEFTITCNEFPRDNLYRLYGGTVKSQVTQSLLASATVVTTAGASGDVIRIPGYNPTIISVTSAATPMVVGVDYDLLGGGMKGNAIRLRSGSTLVTGAATITVTYSLAAIVAGTFPKIWSMDTFNNVNISGTIEISFTDQYSIWFDHRLTGPCFLSPNKLPDYKPDDFATCEFQASFAGAGTLIKIEN